MFELVSRLKKSTVQFNTALVLNRRTMTTIKSTTTTYCSYKIESRTVTVAEVFDRRNK